ncbi:hypothetical protein K1719_000281 [Acacia pycnantha]|nr:hypothetical protein K1719_000281 [Acacia pycnantha]
MMEGKIVASSKKLEADLVSDSNEARKVDIDPNVGAPLSLSEMIRFNRSLGLSRLDDDTFKRGYELIGASKKVELEDRWKKLQIVELELFVKRVELVKDEASLIWEATNSSGN